MSSINKVILIGNVGVEPAILTTNQSKEIATLSIATSESYKDKNTQERKEKTEWHKVVIFNPGIVTIIKRYVSKGTKVYIEGSLQTRKWQDKNGIDKYTTEIVLQGFNASFKILSSTKDSTNPKPSNNTDNSLLDDMDDEIPF